jgi:hypothetical protein
MSNYINVPMTLEFTNDGPLALIAITPLDISAATFVTADTCENLTITGAEQGTGAAGEAVVTGTDTASMAITLTITTSGIDYKVGDTVTVTNDDSATKGFSGDVTFVVTEAMLLDPANEDPVISIPVDDIVGVEIPASAATALTFNTVSRNADLAKWTFTIELDAPSTGSDAIVAVSEAIRKAKQAENSQPSVEWPAGVECYSLVYAV